MFGNIFTGKRDFLYTTNMICMRMSKKKVVYFFKFKSVFGFKRIRTQSSAVDKQMVIALRIRFSLHLAWATFFEAKQKELSVKITPLWWEEVVLIVHFFGFAEGQ